MSTIASVHATVVHDRRVRVLADHIAPLLPEGARVLDIGCGDGLLSARLASLRPDLELHGVDVLVREATHIPVESFDGERIPRGDGEVDVAMLVDVLHHTEDPAALLGEAARVAPIVVLKDHLRDGLFAGPTLRFMDWVGNAPHGVALPYNYWPERRWREAFDALGLDVTHRETRLGLYPWPASWFFGRGLHFVARVEKG